MPYQPPNTNVILQMLLNKQTKQSREDNQKIEGKKIIQQILCLKYHSNLINYRHQLTFDRYYSSFVCQPIKSRQCKVKPGILSYLTQKEYLLCYNSIDWTMKKIGSLIKGQVQKDNFAPILSLNIHNNEAFDKINKRYRNGIMTLPESNTMHTEPSQNREKFKDTQIEKIISSNIKQSVQQSLTKNQDFSSFILCKVTQDLSRMIQNACNFEEKHKNFNAKFIKCFQFKNKTNKVKEFRRMLSETNISAIKSTDIPKDYFPNKEQDCPQQNYGLKKLRKNHSKNHLRKQKKNREDGGQNERIKNMSQSKKKEGKLGLSPLTPKPASISKNVWGWGQQKIMKSRCSFKAETSKRKKHDNQMLSKSPMGSKFGKSTRNIKSPGIKKNRP